MCERAAVIGGGAFGTALALVIARRHTPSVKVWVRCEKQRDSVNTTRENEKYLKGVTLPDSIAFTCDVKECVEGAEIVLLAIPTQFLRAFLVSNRATLPVGVPIVLCAKGIEVDSLQTPFEILRDELPGKYGKYMAALAGPSFAKEMASRQPTFVTVASESEEVCARVQHIMSGVEACFRVYTSDDVVGCEIAGAVKNVLAIASGAATGMGFGNNTRAALVCRGLREMTRLAQKMGSTASGMSGLAGVGDLILTCSSELSRNFTVGLRLSQGESLEDIGATLGAVAEGVATAKSLHALATKLEVDMPICQAVYEVIYEGGNPHSSFDALLRRPLGVE